MVIFGNTKDNSVSAKGELRVPFVSIRGAEGSGLNCILLETTLGSYDLSSVSQGSYSFSFAFLRALRSLPFVPVNPVMLRIYSSVIGLMTISPSRSYTQTRVPFVMPSLPRSWDGMVN